MKRTTITFLVALCVLCCLLSWRTVASRAAMPGPEQPRSAGRQVADASGVTPSANQMSGAAASAACVVPNSMTNPGFETGDLTGWTVNDDRILVDSTAPHSGTYSAKAGPIGRTGLLTQNFPAIPGQQYQVSFWVRNDSGTGPNSYTFFINGSVLERVTDAPAFGYTFFTYTVTAVATFSQVQFIFRNDTGYFYVDDVNVTVICSCDPVVTTTADSGAGSLREAIYTACPGNTITFQPGLTGTITLESELPIPKDLTIVGPGANQLTVSGNQTVRVFNITAENSVTISGLTIANGRASEHPFFPGLASGGGISNGAGTLNLTACTIADNHVSITGGSQISSSTGGGIASGGTLNMTACTLSGNSVSASGGSFFNFAFGGGIYAIGTLNLTNCTIYGNSTSASGGMGATGGGGGIWANGLTTLTACTIYGNSATGSGGNTSNQGSGGGIEHTSPTTTVTVRNSIIAGNTAETGPDSYIAMVISQGYNLIGKNDDGLGFDAGNPNGNLDFVGTSAAPINPMLGPLQFNGGPTKTMALVKGSPAIDTGTCADIPATDQRGVSRPQGIACDIGAYEVLQTPPQITALSVLRTANNPGGNAQIATVSDVEDQEQTLAVTVNGLTVTGPTTVTVNGVTLSNLTVDALGAVRADVTIVCSASTASFTLKVTDSDNQMATATLTVTVPSSFNLGYGSTQTMIAGQSLTIAPATGPAGVASISLQRVTPAFGGMIAVNPGNGVVSVTNATPAGSYSVVIRATASCPSLPPLDTAFTLNVTCPSVTLSAATGTAGTPYNQPIAGAPANGNYSFMQTGGSLPPGLTLQSNGLLTGTPTTAGSYSFDAKATGFGTCTTTQTLTLVIQCPTITLAPVSLPNAQVNTPYTQTITATPAGTTYSFAVTTGLLPAGLTLNSNGSFSGAPTQSGVFNFRVTATGFGSCSDFRDYVLIVDCPSATLAPASLPGGTIGAPYNQMVTASPAGTYSYTVTSGALPPGVMLNAATGAITGTPTQNGAFSFTITAASGGGGACAASHSYSVTIGCTTITLASLASATAGVNYNGSVAASPAGVYSYSLTSGNLPAGLTLNSATGAISGLPTVTGMYNFTLKAQASTGCSGSQSYSLTVACPAITLSALPTPTLNSPYNQFVTASPSGGNYSFAVTGVLPAGLSLNAATGAISGTPTTAGTYNFTIKASGTGSFSACTGSRSYSFTLGSGGCPTITLAELPGGQPGQLYNNAATASPSGSYNYGVTAGSLPPGLNLYGSLGLLYGFPTMAGTFNFTITASSLGDASNCTGSKNYSVVIGGAALRSLILGDFDGDGKADLSVWRGTTGEWLTHNSGDGTSHSQAWGTSAAPYFDVMTPGDYDGDGKMDKAVFRRATGEWLINASKDGAVISKRWGLSTDVPVPGDYDGDGKTDIAVWRGADTNWYIRRSSDGQTEAISWGTSNAPCHDVAVPADYDGDGKTDIAVFRQQNGHWYIKLSSDGSTADKFWGVGSDVPVAADYDGDRKADIAVWRGSEGRWYIVRSSDGAIESVSWGDSNLGDVPAPGDYDGDGKTDFAVWRPLDGRWYVKSSLDHSTLTRVSGRSGDTPVLGRH